MSVIDILERVINVQMKVEFGVVALLAYPPEIRDEVLLDIVFEGAWSLNLIVGGSMECKRLVDDFNYLHNMSYSFLSLQQCEYKLTFALTSGSRGE